jgi:hypothetical protein
MPGKQQHKGWRERNIILFQGLEMFDSISYKWMNRDWEKLVIIDRWAESKIVRVLVFSFITMGLNEIDNNSNQ